jgi:hypothetical protein
LELLISKAKFFCGLKNSFITRLIFGLPRKVIKAEKKLSTEEISVKVSK